VTTGTTREIDAGEFKQQVFSWERGGLRYSRLATEQRTAPSESLFFGSIRQETEVADAHKPVRQDVEEKAADKLIGIENRGLFSVAVFAITVAQSDLALIDGEDTVVGKRHAVSIATQVIENRLR
jgi:hypothetical protein